MAVLEISSIVSIPTLVALFVVVVLYLIYRTNSRTGSRTALRHPPGPSELPFVGSIFTLLFTKLQQHELLFKWSGEYGGIFSFTLAGGRVVVLSDKELIQETLQDPYVNDRIPFPACITIYGRENTGKNTEVIISLNLCLGQLTAMYDFTIPSPLKNDLGCIHINSKRKTQPNPTQIFTIESPCINTLFSP